jgi:hypothetical protein
MSAEKNPVFVESGRRAARKRWGEQRILRLDELRPEARRLVMALVEADAENKKATATEAPDVAAANVGGSTPDAHP